jgi:D-tyrosyl-tRNA(Tyr) deacylase
LVILLGVGPEDDQNLARKLAEKIARMRIFPDQGGKMNLSLLDVGGQALVVPQFTLFADTRRGHRPSFTDAGPPVLAEPLSLYFAECLRELGIDTAEGMFGAHMVVEIINDGPVTISLELE